MLAILDADFPATYPNPTKIRSIVKPFPSSGCPLQLGRVKEVWVRERRVGERRVTDPGDVESFQWKSAGKIIESGTHPEIER